MGGFWAKSEGGPSRSPHLSGSALRRSPRRIDAGGLGLMTPVPPVTLRAAVNHPVSYDKRPINKHRLAGEDSEQQMVLARGQDAAMVYRTE